MRTEQKVREAATILFYERGYHGTTMRDIAAKVGVKAGSLYNHFPGKEDLLYSIVFETTKAFCEGAHAALKDVTGPEERLRALIEWHVIFHARRRYEAKVADNELRSLSQDAQAEVIRIRDEYEELLRSILKDGESQLGWRMPDLHVISIGIETMCTEVAAWYREGGRFSPEKIGRIFAEFILAALKG